MYNAIHRDILDSDKDILQQQSKLMMLNKTSDEYKDRIAAHDKQKELQLKEIASKIEDLEAKY